MVRFKCRFMLLTADSQIPPLCGAAGVMNTHSVPNLDKLYSGKADDHLCNTLASSMSVPTNVVPLSENNLLHWPFRMVNRSNASRNSSMINPIMTSICTALVDRHTKMTIQALIVAHFGSFEQRSGAGGRPFCLRMTNGPAKSTPVVEKQGDCLTRSAGRLPINCSFCTWS